MRFLCHFIPVFLLCTWSLRANEPARRIIGFDYPHLISGNPSTNYRPGLLEQGFRLTTPGDGVYVQNALYEFSPDNGGKYARFIYGAEGLTVVHRDLLPFTPHQVDLAESGSGSVTFVGTKADQTTVSVTFILDRVSDGRGPLQDFETFTFPPDFAGIVNLQVPATLYYLDNLHVTPLGVESAEPAPPPAPLIYDIDWNEAPHQVDAPMAVGGPRAPTSSVFGIQYVRSQIGELRERPLELAALEDVYDQIELACGLGASRYVLEFDITFPEHGSISVFLDHTQGFFRTSVGSVVSFGNFTSNGAITAGPAMAIPATSARDVVRWRFDMDIGAGALNVWINGQQACEFKIQDKTLDLRDIRFSAGSTCGLDNIRVSAFAATPVVADTGLISFGALRLGASNSRTVRLTNRSFDAVVLHGVTALPGVFRVLDSFPRTLAAGEHVDLTIEALALTEGRTYQDLIIQTGAGLMSLGLHVEGIDAAATADLAGVYDGLIGDHLQGLTEASRGIFNLAVTATGSISGNAKIAGKSYPIKGAILTTGGPRTTALVQMALRGQTIERVLEFTGSGKVFSQPFSLYEHEAFTGAKVIDKQAATPFVGLFPTAFVNLAASAGQIDAQRYRQAPLGAGFLQLRLDKYGTARYAGRAADGSALIGSSRMVRNWNSPGQIRIPIHLLPQAGRSFFHGWIVCDGENTDGTFSWTKNPSVSDLTFPNGFANQSLLAIGSRHIALARNEVLMNLNAASWRLRFDGEDYLSQQPKQLTVNAKHKATVSSPGLPTGVSLSVAPAASSFSGGFVGDSRNHPSSFFQGIFVPRLGQGVGFYSKVDSTGRPKRALFPRETGGVCIYQADAQ